MTSWTDADDAILGGDITAALAYVTPAGGVVLATVSPIGMRDREAGTVGFTTSLGFGKKLERMRRDPRVALAYHARDHGLAPAGDDRFLLVQGTASFDDEAPPRDALEEIGRQATPYLGEPKRGSLFWDRWLQAYYADRIPVTVKVERVAVLPGEALPPAAPAQSPPKNGTAPRVPVERAAKRLARLPHRMVG